MFHVVKTLVGVVTVLLLPTSVWADAILSIAPETLVLGNTGGSAIVQVRSDGLNTVDNNDMPVPQNIGAFDLNLRVAAFTGNLAGQQVTINSVTPNPDLAFFFPLGRPLPPPPAQALSSGGTINLYGLGAGAVPLTSTPQNLFTVSFTLPTALSSPADSFTLSIESATDPARNGIANQNNAFIFGGGGSQVIAVPEPSSLVLLPLVGAVGLVRRRRE